MSKDLHTSSTQASLFDVPAPAAPPPQAPNFRQVRLGQPSRRAPSRRAVVGQQFQTPKPTALRPTIAQRFEAFDRENPHIYRKLREFALDVARRGAGRKCSIAALFERIRWFYTFEVEAVDDTVTAKLNNDFRALYARKLMECEPELKGFFATRSRVSA